MTLLDVLPQDRFAVQSLRRVLVDYTEILQSHGARPNHTAPWLSVGRTDRVQGWKLHLSSTATEAPALMEEFVPHLLSLGASFKVADGPTTLVKLNDGSLGQSQIGKFATIYPRTDREARQIARWLLRDLNGFSGPDIATDIHLGGIVYARYGAFNPIVRRDRLGQLVTAITADDGTETLDRYVLGADATKQANHPFADLIEGSDIDGTRCGGGKVIGPGLFITDVLNAQAKGSVFRAIDIRNRHDLRGVVVKQARAHCCSDFFGRDIRDRLQHQADLHGALDGAVPVPRVVGTFAMGADRYLALEYIEGTDLTRLALAGWDSMSPRDRRELLHLLRGVAGAISDLHAAGYIHRDIKPSNIRVGADGAVWLLDLELCHRLDDPEPAFQHGTPGYMSPQQEHGDPPQAADDVYGFGAMLVQSLCRMPPHAVLFDGDDRRRDRILALAEGAPRALASLTAECVARDPAARPALGALVERLSAIADAMPAVGTIVPTPRPHRRVLAEKTAATLAEAARGLTGAVRIDSASGLWLSPSLDRSTKWEVLVSANRGVAGPVYLAARLARAGDLDAALAARARHAVDWLLGDPQTTDATQTGLHFGRAGAAVAVAEAVRAGLHPPDERVGALLERALSAPPDWPDITHGAAGQGIAALTCADLLGEAAWAAHAERYADHLVAEQEASGAWPMPDGVAGMTGERFLGFAHGAAGIAYFLCEYAHRTKCRRADRAWRKAADWIADQAVADEATGGLSWRWSDRNRTVWNWWCHGALGIALSFLRLHERSGEERFAAIADRALATVPTGARPTNLGQCHGLAGVGEVCLEAARVLGHREWRTRADEIAHTLINIVRPGDSGVWWAAGHAGEATADLMSGSSGVAHFLLRWHKPDCGLGFPLLVS